jgi:recombinational DNA repair protein RecT
MSKEKNNSNVELTINSITDLQNNYKKLAENHLQLRFSDNPEFQKEFIKTFSDLVFSQDEEMLEKLSKTRQNTLLNSVFKATEAGASFAKKEAYFIPMKIFKEEVKNGANVKTDTGEYTARVDIDINFQKQQILKLQNCKKFFTAEVHEGVKVIEDLMTGNIIFEGENNVTKNTIGYYAVFITTEGEKYDKFMTNAEIVERANFSMHVKAKNYEKTSSNIHYEKAVVRNLIKEIPKISKELRSIIAYDEQGNYDDYIDVTDGEYVEKTEPKTNQLEEAKKVLAEEKPKTTPKKEKVDKSTGEVSEVEAEKFF